MLTGQVARLPPRVRARAAVDRVRRAARVGQDDDAVVLRRRARPGACGSSSPRRSSRPTSRCRTWRSMQTRPARPDRPAVDLRRLVAGFLRMAPDVAIVGEVRDREALPLLLTLSSGVKGYTTIHAGSARQALTRLRFICQLADTSGELPLSALNTPGQRGDRRRRALRPHGAGPPGHRDRRRRGPGRRPRRHAVHGHRGVPAAGPRRSRWPGRATSLPGRRAPWRDAGHDVRTPARRRRATVVPVTGLAARVVRGVRRPPPVHGGRARVARDRPRAGSATPAVRRRPGPADWLVQAGLADVRRAPSSPP